MTELFILDGISYNVDVMSLAREFSVVENAASGVTQNGEIYRDPIGTYYNYTMTVAQKGNDFSSLDAFWDAISTPDVSHVCVFPYNQTTMTQRMYVTAGTQNVRRIRPGRVEWDEIVVSFTAMAPKVVP